MQVACSQQHSPADQYNSGSQGGSEFTMLDSRIEQHEPVGDVSCADGSCESLVFGGLDVE